MKVDLILPRVWAYSQNVTHQISLNEGHVHGNYGSLHAWAVVPAGQLQDVEVELLHTLRKLMNADTLGFVEHVCDLVPLLLSRTVGEHGEEVEHHTLIKRLE
jgi:hypothetical protein